MRTCETCLIKQSTRSFNRFACTQCSQDNGRPSYVPVNDTLLVNSESCKGCTHWFRNYQCELSGERWIQCLSHNRTHYRKKSIPIDFIKESEMQL